MFRPEQIDRMEQHMQEIEKRRKNGLELFKSLIKDGCRWEGDVISNKWSELLYFDEANKRRVMSTLNFYEEGKDWKWFDATETAVYIGGLP